MRQIFAILCRINSVWHIILMRIWIIGIYFTINLWYRWMIMTCSLPFLSSFWYSNRLFPLAINHGGRIDRTKDVCALMMRKSDKVRDAQMLSLYLNLSKFLCLSLQDKYRFASDYHNILWLLVTGDVLIKCTFRCPTWWYCNSVYHTTITVLVYRPK